MEKGFTLEEKNEQIIAILDKQLHEFCFAAYANEFTYPVASSTSTITAGGRKLQIKFLCKLQKDKTGQLVKGYFKVLSV